jgi:hypothetical protein
MKRISPYISMIALCTAVLVGPTTASEPHFSGKIDSIQEAYRAANWVVAYSTPQERNVLSHYPRPDLLPVSYQTARLRLIHDCMQSLATSSTPVKVVRYSSQAVLPAPVAELTIIETIGEDSNGVGVELTVHQLDVRTNLRLIEEFENTLAEGRAMPETIKWRSRVDANPWRREMHRWRQEDGAWRIVSDNLAMLRTR